MSRDLPPIELELCQLEILREHPTALTRLRRTRDGKWWLNVLLADWEDRPAEFATIRWHGPVIGDAYYEVAACDEHDRYGHVPYMLIPECAQVVEWVVKQLKAEAAAGHRLTLADLLLLPRDDE